MRTHIFGVFSIISAALSEAEPVTEIVQRARKSQSGPVVIFPEGTTSNNQMILNFLPCFTCSLLATKPRVHVVSFKFDNDAPFVVSRGHLHVLRLLSGPHHNMQVKYCVNSEIPALPKTETTVGDAAAAEEYGRDVAKVLALLFQMMQASIGWKEKREFLAYFHEREGNDANKKTK